MGLLVNIITAYEDEIEAIGAAEYPAEQWGGIEAREIDTEKLATLHCLLTDDDFEQAQSAYEPVFVAEDEGVVVVQIPDQIVNKLALLEEEAIELVGNELAATEAFEIQGWAVEEVQALVVELGELARLAESQGQTMFVWMHPLRT
ncbi:MAG: hypothetical protein WAO76_03380 [Georgfuchsia sp.]